MSGITNSAGSRSGVIGTTELEYEEGTHLTASTESGVTISLHSDYDELYYTKIGNVCHISGYLLFSSVSGTSTACELTLPFTAASGIGDGMSAIGCYSVDYTGTTVVGYTPGNNAKLYIRCTQDNAAWSTVPAVGGNQYVINLTYKTA
jgi:hypothetical protein